MSKQKKKWLIMNLGENGRHEFDNLSKVRKWVEDDKKAWFWLPNIPVNPGDPNTAVRHRWETLWSEIEKVIESGTPQAAEVEKVLNKMYGAGQLIHHRSDKGQFFQMLRELGGHGDRLPLLFMNSLVTENVVSKTLPEFTVRHVSNLVKAIFKWSPKGSRARLHQLETQAHTIVQDLARQKVEYESAINRAASALESNEERHGQELEVLTNERKMLIEGQASEFEEFQKRNSEAFSDFFKQIKAEYQAFESFYREKLSLEAPVKYWENSHDRHSRRAMVWGGLFVVSSSGVIAIIVFYFKFIVDYVGSQSSPITIGVSVFVASLVLWLLRMLSRMYLSAYHRAEDAAERVTMIKAYLALRNEEKIDEKHVEFVLPAIFRPGVGGLVKDETAPNWTPAAMLTKQVK